MAISYSAGSALSFNRKPNKWVIHAGIVLLLIALADWLFFGRSVGVTAPIFMLILALCTYGSAIATKEVQVSIATASIPLIAVFPLIETINTLTVIIGVLGLAIFTFQIYRHRSDGFIPWLISFFGFLIRLPFRFIYDVVFIARLWKRSRSKAVSRKRIAVFLLPVLFTLGFLGLFSIANPLIGNWVSAIDILYPFKAFDYLRILFWTAVAILCWPLIHFSQRGLMTLLSQLEIPQVPKISKSEGYNFLGAASVFYALLMFNALFAVQTYLDIVFLWGENELPDGVTYAEYAHRGTYILIVTALLAAAFILFVTRKKQAAETSRPIKALLLLWTIQNIVLVVSTMMRLNLYVEAYALTYLRIAALIWMILVMLGLGFILLRLIMNRPNIWLIKMNMMSLAVVLYAASFVNMPFVISNYNVSAAILNHTKKLDANYLVSLGAEAIPAIERAAIHPRLSRYRTGPTLHGYNLSRRSLGEWSRIMKLKFETSENDWRQWTFRRHRLSQYLDRKPLSAFNPNQTTKDKAEEI
ncbi:MAG: DUF4173 domain-containing protein [Proteobacteria bacterium]|nr:DUF4173 domain-containing protein [Pseudomonadota bacterium]